MRQKLPVFNWSLQKALDSEPDNFTRARVHILYTILAFSVFKCLIVIGIATAHSQWLQVLRAGISAGIFLVLLKIALSRPSLYKMMAHVLIVSTIAIVWTNVIFYTHNINLLVVQFTFMVMMGSFYVLGGTLGVIYSLTSTLPIVMFVIFKGNMSRYLTTTSQELASPGPEIVVTLNFISIALAHYLFFKAFRVNLTEKEDLNRKLQLAIVEANKLAESKSNFLSTMSHELRTPLNSVIGMSELLLQNNTDKGQQENLQILQSSSLDLLALINNVLDFNKTDAQKLSLESVPFDLARLIRDKCLGISFRARDKQLKFIVDIDPQLENITVISDPVRLSQIIFNLVSNAIKFTDQGSITVKLECMLKAANRTDIQFTVSDTGIGIPADRHQKIFEIFTQAETNTTRNYGGTGLGLAIVRQLLTLFNSSIRLVSEMGRGSRFSFIIPFTTTTTEVLPAKADEINGPGNFGSLKILIAEDNHVNRVLLKKQMNKFNAEPTIVENGQFALNACDNNDYDVLFLDLNMPVMDGYETIKHIRALPDPIKAGLYVIAFTASTNEQENLLGLGFDDYLLKPANISDIQAKLEKVALVIHEI